MSAKDTSSLLRVPARLLPAFQNGASCTLIEERRVGEKTKRYVQFPDDYDRTIASDTDEKYMRSLRMSRELLFEQEYLRRYVLPSVDSRCWPEAASLRLVVDLVADSVAIKGQVERAQSLRAAIHVHSTEVECAGTYPITDEPSSNRVPFECVLNRTKSTVRGVRRMEREVCNVDANVTLFDVDEVLRGPIAASAKAGIASCTQQVFGGEKSWKELGVEHVARMNSSDEAAQLRQPYFVTGPQLMQQFSGITSLTVSQLISESTGTTRLRSGVFLAAATLKRFYVIAFRSLVKDGIPKRKTLTDEEQYAFGEFTHIAFSEAEGKGQVLLQCGKDPMSSVDFALRVGSGCNPRNCHCVGKMGVLSQEVTVQCVEFEENPFLLMFGPRMREQVRVDSHVVERLQHLVADAERDLHRAPKSTQNSERSVTPSQRASASVPLPQHVRNMLIESNGRATKAQISARLGNSATPEQVGEALRAVATYDSTVKMWCVDL